MRNQSQKVAVPRPARARVFWTEDLHGMEAPAYETEFETGRHFCPPGVEFQTPPHVFVPLNPNGEREIYDARD